MAPTSRGEDRADGIRHVLLICRYDLAQVFGVHTTRKGSRANKVRNHNGDLAALSSILSGLRGC
jgi:hypothetical protein